jgi:hypothetical protein
MKKGRRKKLGCRREWDEINSKSLKYEMTRK